MVRGDEDGSGDSRNRAVNWARFAGMGTEFAAGLAGFTLAGWWIDRQFDTAPTATVTAAILGIIGGMVHLIRRAYEMNRQLQSRSEERDEQSGHDDDT